MVGCMKVEEIIRIVETVGKTGAKWEYRCSSLDDGVWWNVYEGNQQNSFRALLRSLGKGNTCRIHEEKQT